MVIPESKAVINDFIKGSEKNKNWNKKNQNNQNLQTETTITTATKTYTKKSIKKFISATLFINEL